MSKKMLERMVRVSEFSARFGVTNPTTYKWIHSGRLRVVRFGRNLRITEEEIQDFLRRESRYKDGDEIDGGDAA
jgi:excisionase family DNA binding protein